VESTILECVSHSKRMWTGREGGRTSRGGAQNSFTMYYLINECINTCSRGKGEVNQVGNVVLKG
jgi:hypothetical protein